MASHIRLYSLFIGLILSLVTVLTPSAETPAEHRAQIEADWQRQVVVHSLPDPRSPITTREDAAGGCDGIINGGYGFHTGMTERPWWQVDLGLIEALRQVVIYNRCDEKMAYRAECLQLELSNDGIQWRTVYVHDGKPFKGEPDGKPLRIPLRDEAAQFVRIQLWTTDYLHLDEVEVYGTKHPKTNLALHQPADQSSTCQWSTRSLPHTPTREIRYPIDEVLERGKRIAADLKNVGIETASAEHELVEIADEISSADKALPIERQKSLYLRARWAIRNLTLANPALDFDRLLFVKRVPGSYSHMSDQNYGWWSRPGGGIYRLEGYREDNPKTVCLTESFPDGSFLNPDISYDGTKILFAYCRYYPHLASVKNKVNKEKLPEDGFYHLFEMNADGTGVRQLTFGKYDDFDGRYLPNGEIAFLSTRRGQFVQCTPETSMKTKTGALPDSYVRCGGGPERPVAVYTLHVMDADGNTIRALSPFENFEWTPSISNDGRILYARWDYVDRDNMPFMSLWSCNPDGTNPRIVYGNFTRSPHCIFEARSIPNSEKLLFTASGHHSITAGSLVLLDPGKGVDGQEALVRLTPEVCFPEIEAWPYTYYANPYPLSETYYLTAWSDVPINREGGPNPPNAMGIYLYDAFGNLELLYRDKSISSMYPLPMRPRMKPVPLASHLRINGPQEGALLLQNVYVGMNGIKPGAIRRLRIVGMPAKTEPTMNSPRLGITRDDPGKFVLGTVPVEKDGSAYFKVPSGVGVFFQALDENGYAIRTMRTLTYLQPGQTLTCIGCHEPRNTAPANNTNPHASQHAPSKLQPGPDGSWPFRFDRLVQPVLDRHCVRCHNAESENPQAAAFDLTVSDEAYERIISYGSPSLRDYVSRRYYDGRSKPGDSPARDSAFMAKLNASGGHYGVQLDAAARERFLVWMDVYAQRLGSYSPEQERDLAALRFQLAHLMEP